MLLIALLMTILGGRVIPFFTSRRLQRPQASRPAWLKRLSVGGVAALARLQLLSLLRWEGWLRWRLCRCRLHGSQ